MNILFATSEATPFAKTGGLADVCSSLPVALSELGNEVSIIMPAYSQIDQAGIPIETTGKTLTIPIGAKTFKGELLKSRIPHSNVTVYFVRHDSYFHRDGLYNSGGIDYQDNCERFVFFSRSVLQAIELLDLQVDVIHANDWQTGLVPAYLKILYQTKRQKQDTFLTDPNSFVLYEEMTDEELKRAERWYDRIRSVFTIHNMRHQGRFWRWDMALTGISWRYFTYDRMEFYNQLNLLKTGIIFADAVTTVSPQYAKEIQSEDFGERLQGVLRYRSNVLSGILNGVDTEEWNPATDQYLTEPYSRFDSTTVFEEKPKCKAALQAQAGLPQCPDIPLFGIVSRFDAQKGLDLVADSINMLVNKYKAQFIVLGTGDANLEKRFSQLAKEYPQNVSVCLKFSNEYSHRVEAGSDLFLMPSRYEPCGLNQMYSQLYGTLPIVRRTGGLVDTVVNASNESIADGTANGFSFYWGTSEDMGKAIEWAMFCYLERKEDWKKMIVTAMNQDWTWNRSARKYLELYHCCR
ncbi:MAG: glycogen/starch synthase [Planctomycetia bacterium]|nr:glycogen/starch synthase [Planctomycetia bacterium]